MAHLLQTAMTWLREMQVAHNSTEVIYKRGESTTTIKATIGNSDKLIDQSEGLIINYSDRDFIISRTELPYSEPELADRIIETVDGVTYYYEIIQPNNNDNPWRWSDQYKTAFRIHTKLMKV